MEEGSAQLFTALRGDSWWIVARTGDGQESIKGPYYGDDCGCTDQPQEAK